jgi:hypothetical protein
MVWARSISAVLGDSEIQSLSMRVKVYERLRDAILEALPPLLRVSVQVSPVEEERLVVRCANGTVHLRVRALLPQLLTSVRAAGFSVSEIRFKVEPMYQPIPEKKPELHRMIPAAGCAALERVRQQCRNSCCGGH